MYQLILRLIGSWLMVVCWWGLYLQDNFQPYQAGVNRSLMWIFPIAIVLLVISSWQRRKDRGQGSGVRDQGSGIRDQGSETVQGLSESQVSIPESRLPISDPRPPTPDPRSLTPDPRPPITILILTISLALLLASTCISLTVGYPTFCSSFLCPQVSFVLNLFGFNSGASGGMVLLDGKRVLLDSVKIGLWQILAFALVFSGMVVLARIPWHKRLRLIITGIVCHYLYLIAYAAWMVIFIPKELLPGMELFDAFWGMKMWLGFLPILPLWFWLLECGMRNAECGIQAAGCIPCTKASPYSVVRSLQPSAFSLLPLLLSFSLTMNKTTGKNACATLLLLLLAFSLTMSCFFFGFSHKEGKGEETVIVIDEIHSRWESTLREFNRQEFGMMAENNYHMFLEYISHFHKTYVVTDDKKNSSVKGVITLHEKALSKRLFDSFQGKNVILILKCFTRYPTDEEVNTTVQFVKSGGNILFIGDHTDVFFMDTYVNKVSKRFGIEFVPNAVYVATGGWPVTDRRNMRYHPVTQYMDRFVWATSDILRLSKNAFPLILSPLASYTDQANYYNNYFFGDTMFRPENSMGIHAIMAATEYGKGKVVAWSDSTCFNNEIMFTVDRRGLLSGIFGWFTHSGYINPFPVVAVVVFIILVWYLCRWRVNLSAFRERTLQILLWLIMGITVGWLTATQLNNILYPPQKPQTPLPGRVLFDESHQPANPLTMGNMDQMLGEDSYERFFYHLGRCKYYPEINYSCRLTRERLRNTSDRGTTSAGGATSCLIITTPRSSFFRDEKEDIAAFVKNGGGLLLIEGAGFDATSVNQVANTFGLHFRREPHTLSLDNTFLVNPTLVEGGKTLLAHQDIPIISYVRHGKGLVLAIGDSGMFSNKGSGLYSEGVVWMMNDMIEALGERDEKALIKLDWQMLVRLEAQ
ncbi:hypothetical protein HY792_03245 [Candidatus Desantisbacteria bacterium]|nr:hypothetical protein [Candidatus Desantisbacteria bacterium]